MEDDSKKITHTKGNIVNVSDVFSAFWLRCVVQIHHGYNWFVLGRRYYFLLYLGIFLYILLFIKEIFK
jgi:hypothetical protein